jgi:hypothetical protein
MGSERVARKDDQLHSKPKTGSGSVRPGREKEPLIHAACTPRSSADQRNNVSANPLIKAA